MNHDDAVRLTAVEAYLLGELSPADRDEFEEHFFDCSDCANELRVTATFLEEAKAELANPVKPAAAAPTTSRAPERPPPTSPFAFLWRPAVLSPAFALALLVVVYQNAVVLPRDAGEIARLKNPAIPAELSFVGGNSRGGGSLPKVEVAPGQPFMLSLDIPTEDRYARYACELQDPGGAVVWRAPVTAEQARDTVPIYVPARDWARGTYRLVVEGFKKDGDGKPVQISSYPFALEGRLGAP